MFLIHPVAIFCTAVLGLLLFGLGFAVSLARGKYRVGVGALPDIDHPLSRRVRAHGNTAEFAPFFAVMFLALGAMQPGPITLALMGVATASRVMLPMGLLMAKTLNGTHPLRFAGALGTYLTGLALSVTLLLKVF